MLCTLKPPPDLEYRRFVTNRVVAIVVCLATVTAPFLWNATVAHGPILCPSRGVLGVPCPACGMTRAFCALARLDLPAAVGFNALAIPLAALFLVTPAVALYELSRGRRCQWYRFLYSMRLARMFAVTLLVYHLGRIAVWFANGTLVEEYFKSGWLYRLIAG